MSRYLISGALAACAVVASGSALAGPLTIWGDTETGAVKVRYAPADLTTAQGAREVAAKVRLASASVCGGDSQVIRRMMTARFDACRQAAIARAVEALHSPLVAQAFSGASVLADR